MQVLFILNSPLISVASHFDDVDAASRVHCSVSANNVTCCDCESIHHEHHPIADSNNKTLFDKGLETDPLLTALYSSRCSDSLS